ncbi:MAG: dienelactone hydrolase family protein [Planctomycetes bacterium]|nr:dienelactone hydrolase family protein [Planctomycetota bacterium]
MLRKIFLILLCLAMVWGAGCRKNVVPVNSQAESITVNGLTRTYWVHLPASYDKSRARPLVIVLHGGGGTGEKMINHTLGGLNTLVDKEGFIAVYPDGIEKHWNDGRPQAISRAHKEGVDDVGFISALIGRLDKEFGIDRKRVYVTGISNGAKMSFRLACEMTDKIAAIAAVGGSMVDPVSVYKKPSRPISVMVIHGTDDPLVLYNGGPIRIPFSKRDFGSSIPVLDAVKFWVTHNQCQPEPVSTEEADLDPNDGTRVHKEIYSGEAEDTEVVFYKIQGGGHTWPNGYQYLSEKLVGKTCRDIDANTVIWEFFKRHKRE